MLICTCTYLGNRGGGGLGLSVLEWEKVLDVGLCLKHIQIFIYLTVQNLLAEKGHQISDFLF